MNLYHFSHIRFLIPILKEMKLRPGDNFDYGYMHRTFKRARGNVVSLTRSFNFTGPGMIRDFCLVLDKNILNHHYKLTPYNDYPGSSYRNEMEEIIVLKDSNSYVDISKALKEIIIFDGYLDEGLPSIMDQIQYYINVENNEKDKYISKEYAIEYFSNLSGVPVRIIEENNVKTPKRKHIKAFESYTENKSLDYAVNIIYTVIKGIKNKFKWTSKYYSNSNINLSFKLQIDLHDEKDGYDHPLNYNIIFDTEFESKEDLREIIYFKRNSVFRMIWDLELRLDQIHFDINIGSDIGYKLTDEDILSTDNIEEMKTFLDKQKGVLDHLNKINDKYIIQKGYHFPNFWVEYRMDYDLREMMNSAYKKFNTL
jgi:hypothetical protein